MTSELEQFKKAMEARGIVAPDQVIPDGKLHRCDVEGRNGSGDGAYVFHLNGLVAGGFQNWRDGQGWQNWRARSDRAMTRKERTVYLRVVASARVQRTAEDGRRKREARERAEKIWKNAAAVDGVHHPYLKRKGIEATGARKFKEALVVPIRDTAGALHSLQFIAEDGKKTFLSGGRVQGCYFSIRGAGDRLCIVEGFATGVAVHEATGYRVAVAFSAGNLFPVAKSLKEKFPRSQLVLCADDDSNTVGNPGRTKAREAAIAVGGMLAIPEFGQDRKDNQKDFNDLAASQGLDKVRQIVECAACPVSSDAVFGPTAADYSFEYGGGRFLVSAEGVFHAGRNSEGEESIPRWICSPLRIIAKTRNTKSEAWGRLLEWEDSDRVVHPWAMPMELLQGDGAEVRRELSRRGVLIAVRKSDRDRLTEYIQTRPTEKNARCVERLGWHGSVYVTAAKAVGGNDELLVFQNPYPLESAVRQSGTIYGWQESISKQAAGNSRLVFALSVAFAVPVLEIIGEESGGFHFRGTSSSGKTTALKLAASVWGEPSEYVRTWRATTNGLEGLAAVHNDGLLILDELSQIDAREAGDAAYLLANGQGKARANRNGGARQAARWRLLFLSSGEESLSALMARAGRRSNAGQEIRLADIAADAGAGMGMFEKLNGYETPGALALGLKDAAACHYGTAGLEWLNLLVKYRQALAGVVLDGIRQFLNEALPASAEGQVQRVARRFAVVAAVGEVATHYGLTGWEPGEAEKATRSCFSSWLESFGGGGNGEQREILARVRAFFEAHGASRFEWLGDYSDEKQRVINRVGFVRTSDTGTREFLVLPESFRREVCQGFDWKTAERVLVEHAWILPGADGRATQNKQLQGMDKRMRLYVFTNKIWEADE